MAILCLGKAILNEIRKQKQKQKRKQRSYLQAAPSDRRTTVKTYILQMTCSG